jgi:hypothetical protein
VIIVTIDCSKQPKSRIARSKESWKNMSTIVTTIDCKNQDRKSQRTREARRTLQQLQQSMIVVNEPTPNIARSKESWKNALTTTTRKSQWSRRGERIHYAFNALLKVARFCTQASS